MSKTNYSNFSKNSFNEAKVEVVEMAADAIEVTEVAVEVTAEPEVKVEEEKIESKVGVVSGCTRLRVRKAPKLDAPVVTEIENLTVVVIDEQESTKDFYKVCTEAGVEGYCMRKFITIKA